MLTRRIDAALDALDKARERLPHLRDAYRPGAPERIAIEDLLAAIARTDEALQLRPKP